MAASKSIPHEKAMMQAFKREPELLLEYINSCIEDAVKEQNTASLAKIPLYLKECGYNGLFSLMYDLHYFN